MLSGLRSERLFFEPGATSSALAEVENQSAALVVAMNSRDPFMDFRASMADMGRVAGRGIGIFGEDEEPN